MRIFLCFIIVLAFSAIAFGQQNTGAAAQNFSEVTMAGENIVLEQLRGKVVVMTFWSTRCEICVSEIPELNKLVNKYKGTEVVFLGLAWQDTAKLQEFLKKKPFNFKIIPQSFGVLLKYADKDAAGRLSMGFPSHFIVNQNGEVVYKSNGFDKSKKIDSTITQLLSSYQANLD